MDTPADTPAGSIADLGVDEVFASTYRELKHLAHARLRGAERDAMLDTTALVHETYLKLGSKLALRFPDRLHFLSYASRVMRSVIVDLVRQRAAARHGGDFALVTLTESLGCAASGGESEILQVHEALQHMARIDPRMAQVVEMRYFGGMTDPEIAAALGVSERTVRRDWEHARLALAQALQ